MPMTPERWKRIDQLYNEALSQKTEDRPAYLHQRSGDDEDLRSEVESLLEAHDRFVRAKTKTGSRGQRLEPAQEPQLVG